MNSSRIKLDLKSINYRYTKEDDFNLEILSLEIPENTITSLIGKNGSGKTTLFLIMMGYLKPISGRIKLYLDGKYLPIDNSGGKIAFLPQRENFSKKNSVNDFLLLGRTPFINNFTQPSTKDYRKVEEVKNLLGIDHLGEKKINKLSGGEFQIVRIGRTLAQEADILIFDEPTSHLDISAKIKIFNLIRILKGLGKTILFSTHDPLDAFQIAENSILIDREKGIRFGPTDKLLNDDNLSLCLGTIVNYRSYKGQKFLFLRN
jgi:iron complex transport system ATP-binding protein